jgi:hypothetical protein
MKTFPTFRWSGVFSRGVPSGITVFGKESVKLKNPLSRSATQNSNLWVPHYRHRIWDLYQWPPVDKCVVRLPSSFHTAVRRSSYSTLKWSSRQRRAARPSVKSFLIFLTCFAVTIQILKLFGPFGKRTIQPVFRNAICLARKVSPTIKVGDVVYFFLLIFPIIYCIWAQTADKKDKNEIQMLS